MTRLCEGRSAYHVCFVVYVKTKLIAKLIEATVLGIVAQAYTVYVVLSHYLEIFAHKLFGNVVSCGRIVLVYVYAFEFDGLSVNQKYIVGLAVGRFMLALCKFKSAEAYIVGDYLAYFAIFFKRNEYFIEVGML